MDVVVALEARFARTPDGAVWTIVGFARPSWDRYLQVFDRVSVVARVLQVDWVSSDWVRADGERVSFVAVPHYLGPWQYLLRAVRVKKAVRNAVGPEDAVILRVGSQLAAVMEPALIRSGRPFGLEVVGDPYDVFAPGAVAHPLRPIFRRWFSRQLRRQCGAASAVAYVTEYALQSRYPPGKGAFATHFSDIELPGSAFASAPRSPRRAGDLIRSLFVGSLEQLYKSPDVLIDAVGACCRRGMNLRMTMIGDGKYRPELEERVRQSGLSDRLHFLGQVPAGEAVRARMDEADLFILPSRTEGLPRAMIEAMARGLPCIGSTVGGIPELLPPEDMVPPGDVEALAAKIEEVVSAPDRMARMSSRNLEKAREYRDDLLRSRRINFYRHVKGATQEWITAQGR